MDYEGRPPDTSETLFELRGEPDCSSHPFDIMAMFAIYQTIPR